MGAIERCSSCRHSDSPRPKTKRAWSMTSSVDAATPVRQPIEPLPPALSSMWRLCTLGYRHEPRLMLAAFALSQLAALPDALIALWLMLLGRGVLENRRPLVFGAAIGLAVSAAATWLLSIVS